MDSAKTKRKADERVLPGAITNGEVTLHLLHATSTATDAVTQHSLLPIIRDTPADGSDRNSEKRQQVGIEESEQSKGALSTSIVDQPTEKVPACSFPPRSFASSGVIANACRLLYLMTSRARLRRDYRCIASLTCLHLPTEAHRYASHLALLCSSCAHLRRAWTTSTAAFVAW